MYVCIYIYTVRWWVVGTMNWLERGHRLHRHPCKNKPACKNKHVVLTQCGIVWSLSLTAFIMPGWRFHFDVSVEVSFNARRWLLTWQTSSIRSGSMLGAWIVKSMINYKQPWNPGLFVAFTLRTVYLTVSVFICWRSDISYFCAMCVYNI
jgi:hypothetical protein